jgi:hypothetical protein
MVASASWHRFCQQEFQTSARKKHEIADKDGIKIDKD